MFKIIINCIIMSENTYKLTVVHVDSWESGPHLRIKSNEKFDLIENTSSKSESKGENGDPLLTDDMNRYVIHLKTLANKYTVYQLLLGIEGYDSINLKVFENLESAVIYSKQQYKLFTDDYPFITTGLDWKKAEGSRPEIEMDSHMICEIKTPGYDDYSYIIIIADNHVETHSLDGNAEW